MRRVGRVRELEAALPERLNGTVGIARTRWAKQRIDVPRNEPELDPILFTIPMQLLAYHAAPLARPRHGQAL